MTFKVKDGLALGNTTILDASGNITVPEKLTLSNTTTTRSSLNLGTGAADPSAPATGDVWLNSGTLKIQQAGGTKTLAYTDSNITGTATKSTNIVGGNSTTLLGAMPYQSNTDTTTLLSPNTTTTKKFLRQTGTGTNGAAPAWDTLVDGDVPSALTGKTYNALSLTANASGFSVAGGTTSKTLTVNNTLTIEGTDASTVSFGAGGTVAYQGGTLGQFAPTTSAALAGVLNDETGFTTGALAVFNTSPTFVTDIRTPLIYGSTAASGSLTLSSTTNVTKGAVIVGGTGDAVRLNTTTNGFVKTSGGNGTLTYDTNAYYAANGTDVTVTDGGTGTSTAPTQGGIIFGASTSAYGSTSAGSSGQVLQSNGTAAPTWSSTTFPSTTTAGDILYASANNVLSVLSIAGTNGKILKSDGATISWATDVDTYPTTWSWTAGTSSGPTGSLSGSMPSVSVAAIPSASDTASGVVTTGIQTFAGVKTFSSTITGTITKATNLVGGNATTLFGSIPYQSAADTTTLLGPNTLAAKRFLTATGNGTNGGAPNWAAILDADIPNLTGKTYNGLTLTANATGFSVAGGTTSKTLTVNNSIGISGVDGKTLTVTNSIGLAGTDGSSLNIGTGGTLGTAAYTATGAYATASHTHGNVTNGGAIGSTANLPLITTTSGLITTGTFGTTTNTFCAGDDSRLSNTRNTTNSLTFNNGGAGAGSGTTFNGGTAQTISYNTIGAAAAGQTMYIGTTAVTINRASANLALSGITSIDGTAANATNVGIAADTTTATTFYVPYASATTGNVALKGTRLTVTPSTGDFTAAGNVTAYSDERLKTNWRDLDPAIVSALAGVKVGIYERTDTEATQVGVSAQSLQKVLPEAVNANEEGMLSVAYGNAALAAAVMLARKVEELEARLAALEAK